MAMSKQPGEQARLRSHARKYSTHILISGRLKALVAGSPACKLSMPKVLVVEDDVPFAFLIEHHLRHDNHTVEVCRTGLDGLQKLKSELFDLAILDWVLPDMLGVDICKKFREGGGKTPILILTGKDTSEEKALGLDSGADDYLVKPFDATELLARLRALLRRAQNLTRPVMRVQDVEMDTLTNRVMRAGKEIDLAQKEIAILELLMRHPNQRFTAEQLMQKLWRSDASASPDTVRTHMKTLRKKLGDQGNNAIIKTTRHLGYRIVSPDNHEVDTNEDVENED